MEKLLFLKIIGEYSKEQGKNIIKDGKIVPCLAENYIAYDNSLQRNLKGLYDLDDRPGVSARDKRATRIRRLLTGPDAITD